MDQVLEAALRRRPKPLKAVPPTIVEGGEDLPTPDPVSPRLAFAGARSRRTSRRSWSEAASGGAVETIGVEREAIRVAARMFEAKAPGRTGASALGRA